MISAAAPPDDRGDVRDDVREDIRALEAANVAPRGTIIAHEATIADLRRCLDAPEGGPGLDAMTAIAMQTLSQAVERERDRADRAERQAEVERQLIEEGRERIDGLQASLADERRRIDGLYIDLADARTAAMISGSEAAALRTQLALLTERRPRWRRWFR